MKFEKIEHNKLIFDNWKYPDLDGMPDDGELCMVVWKCHDGELDIFVGGYFPEKKQFWSSWGFGGAVLDEEHVVHWKSLLDYRWGGQEPLVYTYEKVAELKDRLRLALSLKNKKSINLVEDLKIPQSAFSQYLTGISKNMDSTRLHDIAEYLNVSEPWLLGYDVPMENSKTIKNRNVSDIYQEMRASKNEEVVEYDYSNLKSRIIERCGSIKEFASEIGISRTAVYNKLNGELGITQKDIEKWSKPELLDIKESEFSDYYNKKKAVE